jgi:hypothetical protein
MGRFVGILRRSPCRVQQFYVQTRATKILTISTGCLTSLLHRAMLNRLTPFGAGHCPRGHHDDDGQDD